MKKLLLSITFQILISTIAIYVGWHWILKADFPIWQVLLMQVIFVLISRAGHNAIEEDQKGQAIQELERYFATKNDIEAIQEAHKAYRLEVAEYVKQNVECSHKVFAFMQNNAISLSELVQAVRALIQADKLRIQARLGRLKAQKLKGQAQDLRSKAEDLRQAKRENPAMKDIAKDAFNLGKKIGIKIGEKAEAPKERKPKASPKK